MCVNYSIAQNAVNIALIEFKDKDITNQSIQSYIDLPISKYYIQQLESEGMIYKTGSNWLNIGLFAYTDVSALKNISLFPFIKKISLDCINKENITQNLPDNKFQKEIEFIPQTNVRIDGTASYYLPQILQLNGDYIQDLGYNGTGIKIAIIDAGFPNANTLGSLQHIYQSNRLLGRYDFYQNDSNVYANNSHGTNTFSIIGGLNDNFSGSAPNASFYLFRTEVDAFEGQTEEFFLSQALERCVELGVKVTSISLGYENNGGNGFNDGTTSHTLTDMNGHTTIAAKAANIAASKGIIVCVSAGNEGVAPWHYIVTPADADSAFTIGAVDINGYPASFSSYNFDTSIRVKPNVAAMGVSTAFINQNNSISYGPGTSYSCPIIAGLSACLWQAFPNKTAWQVKTAIEQSASQYLAPDKHIGYGIPDFKKAYQILSAPNEVQDQFILYPNPVTDNLYIRNNSSSNIQSILIYNSIGQLVYSETNSSSVQKTIPMNNLTSGMFISKITTTNGDIFTKKIIKE